MTLSKGVRLTLTNMPLQPLVDFIQDHFADFRGFPDPNQQSGSNQLQASDNLKTVPVAPRPPVPDWIVQPAPDALIFPSEPASWRIEGSITMPRPPANIGHWGPDVLAFYLPFHFYQSNWGTYLLASGVVYVASVLKGGTLLPGDEPFLDRAETLLQEHELFHFAAEVACSRAEIIAKGPLYSTYFSHFFGAPHEEALANARTFNRIVNSQTPQLKTRISSWMKKQGVGYRDFDKWIKPLSFHQGGLRATTFMTEPLPPIGSLVGPADFLFHGVDRYSVPPFRVNDLAHGAVGLLRPFPKEFGMQLFTHSNDHPPPHIHIQCPPGARDTRYRWPELTPLKGDPLLSKAGERKLREYMKAHRQEISKRLQDIYESK